MSIDVTSRRTPDRYIYFTPHIMRAMSIILLVVTCNFEHLHCITWGIYQVAIYILDLWIDFYRAMLCIRVLAMAMCPSVCLSVTSRSSTKTAKRRITQTTPHNTPGILVFWCQRSPRNTTGVTPHGGAECRWGGSKSATFDILQLHHVLTYWRLSSVVARTGANWMM